MIKKVHVLIVVCICSIWTIPGCKESSVRNKDRQYSSEQLQAVVDEYLKDKTHVLGTIVRVDIQGGKFYEAARGYFDSSRTIPVHPETRFSIGSISKVFTAVLVHQLVEKGRVQLQNAVIDYLPPGWAAVLEDIPYDREITVELVLSHRSGIADITETEDFRMDLLSDPAGRWTRLEALKRIQEQEPHFKPGDRFDYCNINYILLEALIENVSGTSYGVSLQENILKKIGLDNTFLAEETFGSTKEGIAHSYFRMEDRMYDGHEINMEWALATGGIISNADDLIKFYGALASGSLFDRKETYEQMCQLVGNNESYGRGLEVIDDPDIGLYYGHRGSLFNTRAILAYFP